MAGRSTSASSGKAAAGGDEGASATSSGRQKKAEGIVSATGDGKAGSSRGSRSAEKAVGKPSTKPTGKGEAGPSAPVAQGQPHGRDEVIESIIEATLSLWSSQGPAKLSLRGIASKAGVNYGLVYRHFGTKDAVIRAALNRRLERGLEQIADSSDLMDVMDVFLGQSTGSYARLLAWATLQYVLDDILPPQDLVLQRTLELARQSMRDQGAPVDEARAAVLVGSLIAMVYGWRLFGPYLVPELGLAGLSQTKRDALIREVMTEIIQTQS